ncbi:plasmid mobilization relaxosome protein MobC, partial [Aeromonas caviae]|uniref:plasmid mobilization relaxosome protein MobC n=1 Tax=Aeromonas caviae TaxID=648 RepID=UPI001CC68A63
AWAALARTAANLNQIAHRLNAGDALPLAEVRATLDAYQVTPEGVERSPHLGQRERVASVQPVRDLVQVGRR